MSEQGLLDRVRAAQKQQVWALKSEDAKRLHAMVDLARSEPEIAIDHMRLDGNTMLFNCVNGTIDLRTGKLKPHCREDLITQVCPTMFDPDAICDLWADAVLKIFDGKRLLAEYFQRLCGYCLSGEVNETILPLFHGAGSNGKSLIMEVIREVMGTDYAGVGTDELLIAGTHKSHPTYLAALFAKRLVTLAETPEGGRLNETQIKRLTGGDKIAARRMKEDFWEFAPTHKIWLATNHKPEVKGTDHGIWRRLRLIPFTVRFWDADKGETGPEELRADKSLKARLLREAPGILAWMVRGCLEWQQGGLSEPEEVLLATESYRIEQDTVAAFIRERCRHNPSDKCRAGDLYQAYRMWLEAAGERGKPMTLRRFGESMRDRGYQKKESNGSWYLGISLHTEETETPW